MHRTEAHDTSGATNIGRDTLIITALLALVGIVYSAAFLIGRPPEVHAHDAPRIVSAGNQLMDTGRFDEAIAHYGRALALDSTLIDVRVDRGSCYHALGRYENAISDFTEALAIMPDHLTARFNLGISWSALGNDSAAVASWEMCLALQPDGRLADRVRQLLEKYRDQRTHETGD